MKKFKQAKKTWADRQGIRTGILGERFNGIRIEERNRATVYERYRKGIEELRDYLQKNYRSKGVRAELFGVEHENGDVYYAVFVEDGFLREVGPEE